MSKYGKNIRTSISNGTKRIQRLHSMHMRTAELLLFRIFYERKFSSSLENTAATVIYPVTILNLLKTLATANSKTMECFTDY